ANIVSAYISVNSVPADALVGLITSVHASLKTVVASEETAVAAPPKPVVSVKSSVKPDFIICLEDGKRFKSLKRHLMVHYGLTPEEYRAKWNLPPSYPMVAPNYAVVRSRLAKSIGLGRKPEPAERRPAKAAAQSEPKRSAPRQKAVKPPREK
ncbi:MucR family transcriptional regulator, partial [Rhizobiaceae sp. 2RAB30]